MVIEFPPSRGYFDKYDFRAALADPIGSDIWFRVAIDANPHTYRSRPGSIRNHLFVPTLLKWNGWMKSAAAAYERLTTMPGLEAEGYAGLADIAHLYGRWQQELRGFEELGIHMDACRLFGIAPEKTVFSDDKDWLVEASKFYERAVALDPSNANLLAAYSALAVDRQDHELAVELLEKALAIAPHHPLAEFRLGQIRGLAGGLDEMGRRYRSAAGKVLMVDKYYHRHNRADIVTLAEACRRRDVACDVRQAPVELSYRYQVAYGSEVKTYRTCVKFDAGRVATFDEVTDLGLGLLYLSDGEPLLIRDSKHLPPQSLPMFAPAVQIFNEDRGVVSLPRTLDTVDEGPIVVLPGYVNNYFHWMMEALGTLVLLENDPRLKTAKILVHDTLKGWHRETLAMLGIGADRVIEYPTAPVTIRDAICPLVLSRNTVVHPAAVDYLRRNMARPAAAPTPGKRVFLTRARIGGGRKATNEQEVRWLLEQHGFETVDPGTMSIAAQRDFFADVEMIVAPGGAALTNMLFCPAGTKILSIACVHSYEETFSCLAAILNQKFWACLNDGRPKPNPYYLWCQFDFEIDLENLKRSLRAMIDDVSLSQSPPAMKAG